VESASRAQEEPSRKGRRGFAILSFRRVTNRTPPCAFVSVNLGKITESANFDTVDAERSLLLTFKSETLTGHLKTAQLWAHAETFGG
jgi:hypothetical protein